MEEQQESVAEKVALRGKVKRQTPSTSSHLSSTTSGVSHKRRRSSYLWKLDRWALKATSQLRLFTNWLSDHEYNPERILQQTDIDDGVLYVDSALRYSDDTTEIVICTSPLPSAARIVERGRFGPEGATDVSCYETNGTLISVNFAIAQLLVATRKSVRMKLCEGPWPACDLLINPASTQSLHDDRYMRLCKRILVHLRAGIQEFPGAHVRLFMRLGLDVISEERSLIVCATGDSPKDAKETTRRIWKRALKLQLSPPQHDGIQ